MKLPASSKSVLQLHFQILQGRPLLSVRKAAAFTPGPDLPKPRRRPGFALVTKITGSR